MGQISSLDLCFSPRITNFKKRIQNIFFCLERGKKILGVLCFVRNGSTHQKSMLVRKKLKFHLCHYLNSTHWNRCIFLPCGKKLELHCQRFIIHWLVYWGPQRPELCLVRLFKAVEIEFFCIDTCQTRIRKRVCTFGLKDDPDLCRR